MAVFREIPPTAGYPISLRGFFHWFKAGSLEQDLKDYLNLGFVSITYSGTAAFYLILEALKELSPKTTVVVPAYVCPLLALAIKRAGLKVAVCDIRRNSFDFDLLQLEDLCSGNDDILAVVAVHLGGIPIDFKGLEGVVKKRGIFIIEDCAQALGAAYNGKLAGTLGDFSFFSLCRGKGLTIYEGGVVATGRKEFADLIAKKTQLLVRNNFLSEALKILELFGYWIFYRPHLFWFVFRLPQLFWRFMKMEVRAYAEYYSEDFPIHNVSKIRKSVAHAHFGILSREIAKQRDKARVYLEGLKDVKGIYLIKEQAGTSAIYPYLTLVFDNPDCRRKALKIFENSGLGVSLVYLYALTDYAYLKPIVGEKKCPNASYLAQRQITLPTGTFLGRKEQDLILEKIRALV